MSQPLECFPLARPNFCSKEISGKRNNTKETCSCKTMASIWCDRTRPGHPRLAAKLELQALLYARLQWEWTFMMTLLLVSRRVVVVGVFRYDTPKSGSVIRKRWERCQLWHTFGTIALIIVRAV